MRLKITWMPFLRLGSLLILIAFMGCKEKEKIDAFIKADWVFKNTSTHNIEVVSKDFNSFIIQQGESYTYSESGEGPEDITPNDYISPYRAGDKIIVDNSVPIILQKGESITSVTNYEAKKVRNNYYIFTFTFTDDVVD